MNIPLKTAMPSKRENMNILYKESHTIKERERERERER